MGRQRLAARERVGRTRRLTRVGSAFYVLAAVAFLVAGIAVLAGGVTDLKRSGIQRDHRVAATVRNVAFFASVGCWVVGAIFRRRAAERLRLPEPPVSTGR
jgi:hypothetical protein